MVRVARYPLSAHGKRRIVIGMVSVDRAVLQRAPITSASREETDRLSSADKDTQSPAFNGRRYVLRKRRGEAVYRNGATEAVGSNVRKQEQRPKGTKRQWSWITSDWLTVMICPHSPCCL